MVGVGKTNRWCIGSLDETVSLALVFDTATLLREETNNKDSHTSSNPMQDGQSYYYNQQAVPVAPSSSTYSSSSIARKHDSRFFQFVLRYVTLSGQHRVRITSIRQPIAPTCNDALFFVSHKTFDATAAATIVSRLAISFL